MSTRAPVFLGGPQRSGTSLLRAILGSHDDLAFYPWDLPLWTELYPAFGKARHLSMPDALRLLDAALANRKAALDSLQAKAAGLRASILALREPTCDRVFNLILEAYRESVGRPRWGLKTPYNELYCDPIFDAHPDAVMIQLIRDPRDVLASQRDYDQHARRWYNPVAYSRAWCASAAAAVANSAAYPDRYLVVRYEDLVADPEPSVRKACELCGLEYSSDLLEMDKQFDWSGSNSSHPGADAQGATISSRSHGRFKTTLSDAEILLSQSITGRYLPMFGYDPAPVRATPASVLGALQHTAVSLAGTVKSAALRQLRK